MGFVVDFFLKQTNKKCTIFTNICSDRGVITVLMIKIIRLIQHILKQDMGQYKECPFGGCVWCATVHQCQTIDLGILSRSAILE